MGRLAVFGQTGSFLTQTIARAERERQSPLAPAKVGWAKESPPYAMGIVTFNIMPQPVAYHTKHTLRHMMTTRGRRAIESR